MPPAYRSETTPGRPSAGVAGEFVEAPGILACFVLVHEDDDGDVNVTAADLLDLATHAIAAAQWLEAHR